LAFDDFHDALVGQGYDLMAAKDTRKDVIAKAKSMSRWIWDNYRLPVKRKTADDIREARTLGARKAARIVADRNGKAVADAIAKLTAAGLKVSKAAVARETGLSDRTVAKYWSGATEKVNTAAKNTTVNRVSAPPTPKSDAPIDKKPVFLPALSGSEPARPTEPNQQFSTGLSPRRPLGLPTPFDTPRPPRFALVSPLPWHRSIGPP
jgi:vacuolar-type H+-ATPase subunit H